jgi:hypothetical protein
LKLLHVVKRNGIEPLRESQTRILTAMTPTKRIILQRVTRRMEDLDTDTLGSSSTMKPNCRRPETLSHDDAPVGTPPGSRLNGCGSTRHRGRLPHHTTARADSRARILRTGAA